MIVCMAFAADGKWQVHCDAKEARCVGGSSSTICSPFAMSNAWFRVNEHDNTFEEPSKRRLVALSNT